MSRPGTGRSSISSPQPFEAPNWTPDGSALIYNRSGRAEGWGGLYRFDLATRQATLIDTGVANRNNNDHVLSFDGSMLGLSDQSQASGGRSTIYTVPVGGGTPKRITTLSPSYLHSWSPDGKDLIFTGGRNNEFDIYRIPADGSGPEVNLTNTKGLDDGPEYTPDGKYIYFNSARTGTMQVWRMKPDGRDQEQVTNDEYNNWFPHISPDGKWIAIISFQKDVPANDHPYYKRVYIRLMPAAGGAAKVIAYVYGGQGTINVPSWSPDSRMLAFVSNTDSSPSYPRGAGLPARPCFEARGQPMTNSASLAYAVASRQLPRSLAVRIVGRRLRSICQSTLSSTAAAIQCSCRALASNARSRLLVPFTIRWLNPALRAVGND